jgi:ferritin-like protein
VATKQRAKRSRSNGGANLIQGADHVTQVMVIDILRDEERHRRLFEGFLREYEAEDEA